MANRAVLGAFDGTYVLRVSKPGFNVLSTGLTVDQLAFDSRWAETGNAFMSGSAAIGSEVSFGTTFSKPPFVVARIKAVWGGVQRWYVLTGGNDGEINYYGDDYLFVGTSAFRILLQSAEIVYSSLDTVFYYTVYRNFYG